MRSRPATSQRRRAVKVKMPEVPEEPDVHPIAHPGKKGVHQCDPVHFGGILSGVGVGDHQPDIVAYNPDALVPEQCREGVDVLRHRLLVVTALRLGRLPEAAQIGGDHAVRLGEFGNEGSPHMAGLGVAMQKKHRIAFAGAQIVQLDPVDLREAAIDRDRLLCRHGVTTISATTPTEVPRSV